MLRCKLLLFSGCRIPVKEQVKQFCDLKRKPYLNVILSKDTENVDEVLKNCAHKLIYNSVLEKKRIAKYKFVKDSPLLKKVKRQEESIKSEFRSTAPLSIALKYLSDDLVTNKDEKDDESEIEDKQITHFPYNSTYELPTEFQSNEISLSKIKEGILQDLAVEANEEVRKRHELQKEMKNWMTAYDNYDDKSLSEEYEDEAVDNWKVNYGTPDPKSPISNVPCGGCGALLHCKDTAIPGYIPSEIFKSSVLKGSANLEAIICQRCHFLKHYNLALQMQVTPESYPKILATVSKKAGLVILMVDLLDFPCSIWPGIGEIFGKHTPVVVVGNKVDLLPKDSRDYLQRIKNVLIENVKLSGFATFNIKHVALISAKTGYGIEELITRVNSLYRQKGDVYLVGCTNVGKSSLFNALLQSDYCKIRAADLIQRATVSVWPGTTLNLLKFPIKRPAGYQQYLRQKRLEDAIKVEAEERKLRLEQLRATKDHKYATLVGHIGITKSPFEKVDESKDYFSIQGNTNASGKLKMGINEKSMEFAFSKWCFDTPGVVQPDQIVHLLTTEELLLTLPKELIQPRSFCLQPNSSLFIAGLSRLDYLEGSDSVRLTVFASKELPITICGIKDAEELYQELLGSDLLKVPTRNQDRISKWPKLELTREFSVIGEGWKRSSKDVVLSSSGWIAITGRQERKFKFQAWTPEKRGVYIRNSILPHAIALAGHRLKGTVAYKKHKFYM